MVEKHSTGLGCLIFICVVSEIVKCIFVYPKMQHEFKGFYIQGDTLFGSICWTASLWFGYLFGAAIVAIILYFILSKLMNNHK